MSNTIFQSMSKARNTLDELLNDYVGRGDAMLCLDVNIGSSEGTYFLLDAPRLAV